MSDFPKSLEFHLAQIDDEALVVLAKECESEGARRALLLRYQDWVAREVTSLARRRGVAGHDLDDAIQEARFFGLSKAIDRYDTVQLTLPRGCRFRSFLRRVITDRFKDFLKHLRRVKARHTLLRVVDAGGEPGHGESACRRPWGGADHEGDPAGTAAREELRERVRGHVSRLSDGDRLLVQGVSAGNSLRALAPRLGLSYDTAKRRWRKLLGELAARLERAVG
jgi:RNA polymerase sigma factor (sigma-70 family)